VAKTTAVLGVIAAGLLAYILLVDRGTLSTGELERRDKSVIPELIRDRVSRLEIQRRGQSTVLTRDAESDDEAGLWQVAEPYRAKADGEAVDILLGELEWMDVRRRLTDISESDNRRFGFDSPRYRVFIQVGKARAMLRVGNETPTGDGLYAQGTDRTRAYVVGKDLIEALDHEPEHYHDKALHAGLLVATARAVELKDESGSRAARRRDDRLWELSAGGKGFASTPNIEALIRATDGLRASRFIEKGDANLERHGLTAPNLELTLTHLERAPASAGVAANTDGGAAKPEPRVETTLRLRVGAPCGGHEGERYVTLDQTGGEHDAEAKERTISCVQEADLEKLRLPLADLRESRLLPFAADDVSSLTVKSGARQLTLEEKDGGWAFALRQGGKELTSGQAREGSVDDFFRAASAEQALGFDAAPPGAGALTVEIERAGGLGRFALRAGASGPGLTQVQRGDEPVAVAFGAQALELLEPRAASFLSLKLPAREAESLRELSLSRGDGSRERLERGKDGRFQLLEPVAAAADAARLSEIVRLLSTLEAVRFDADAPQPQHGLQQPVVEVVAHFGDERMTLKLGAETEGGHFASIAGAFGVFVAPAMLGEQLEGPLLDRSALATPLETLRAFTLQRGARRVRVVAEGTGFRVDNTAGGSPLDPTGARALAEALATLRAHRVLAYGAAAESSKLAKPLLRIELEVGEKEAATSRYNLVIGPQLGEGDGAEHHARRDDHDATFVLPAAGLSRLLEALSP